VATASNDRTARVWDATTSQALTPPLRHGDVVGQAVFSLDGLRVATASRDGARIWELAPQAAEEDPTLLAQALAARRIDDTGALVFVTAAEFQSIWTRVRTNR
jgi:hypothetical protein